MFKLHSCAACKIRYKAYVYLGSELFTGIRLPAGTDFPTHDEPLSWLPHTHVTNYRLGSVRTLCVPASTDKGLDNRF